MARILAFDFGERRIGVAASDPTRTIASPLATVQRRAGKRPPYTELLALIHEQEADALVVGLPLDLSGEETSWTAEVRAFGEGLASRAGLPVHWMDERMTSVRAELAAAEKASGQARTTALSKLAAALGAEAASSSDRAKVTQTVAAINQLVTAR